MSVWGYKDERNAPAGQTAALFVNPTIPHLGLVWPNNDSRGPLARPRDGRSRRTRRPNDILLPSNDALEYPERPDDVPPWPGIV